ncbi:hypothetical protein PR048_009752 [Dryococelus australis]|uniref:Uncharacterized protein n=1 Tax=Dryococelus australis TaxID=614101 RepID=A0ABQ9I1R0_9NEOP|nr:hypothetical protein PR048_009752 [Dryococelus australis]
MDLKLTAERPKSNSIHCTLLSMQEYIIVQLYCDVCQGQNKNITMLGMLAKYLQIDAPPNSNTIVLSKRPITELALDNINCSWRKENLCIFRTQKFCQIRSL